MVEKFDFSDISPYRDKDVSSVLERIVENPAFMEVMQYVIPGKTYEEIKADLQSIDSIKEFQSKVAYTSMKKIMGASIGQLTFDGFSELLKNEACLFISNHRDIILDSAILNVLFHEQGFNTTQTAIGDNLLTTDLVMDLMMLNKNFIVTRNVAPKEKYEQSYKLSAYIHKTIVNDKESIWISQKEGRAKDGNDRTQPGLLKMLSLHVRDDFSTCFQELNIRPTAVSYEYDPCDYFKIRELLTVSKGEIYKKAEREDLQNIISGITGNKGNVHISITKKMNREIDKMAHEKNVNERLRLLALAIDKRIHQACKLWPNNYLAADMFNNENKFSHHYSKVDKDQFNDYINNLSKKLEDPDAKKLLLKKYAYPLWNQLERELV